MLYLIMIIIAFSISRIRVIGKYIYCLETLIHESGHALMSLLTSGKVRSIRIFYDKSGAAETDDSSWSGGVLTTMAGYPFSSAVSFLLFYLYASGEVNWILYILMGFVLVNLLLWVRNLYGAFWLLTFGGILYFLYINIDATFTPYVLLFFISVILIESLYSSFTILKLSLKDRKNTGDASNLARKTFIPTMIWGVAFFVQALYFSYLSILQMLST